MAKIPYHVDKGYDEGFVKILKKTDLMVFTDKSLKSSSILKTNEEANEQLDRILKTGRY